MSKKGTFCLLSTGFVGGERRWSRGTAGSHHEGGRLVPSGAGTGNDVALPTGERLAGKQAERPDGRTPYWHADIPPQECLLPLDIHIRPGRYRRTDVLYRPLYFYVCAFARSTLALRILVGEIDKVVNKRP